MTTIASLPVIDVWIGFNPTNFIASTGQALPASGASNSYWTYVGKYVRDFSTRTGKQHYLDRVEAATLKMTLNNRDGFFNNTHQIAPRMPVAIQATWNGTTYPIYFGIIDTIREKVGDQLNSDLDIEATDLTKYLSLKYLYRPSFWQTYANSAATKNWYRCSNYSSTVVTSAVGSGSTVTYYCTSNAFKVGDNVTVSGLGGNQALNVSNATVTAISANSFTVSVTAPYTSTGAGVAYNTTVYDLTSSAANGTFVGQVSYPQHGVLIYDTNGCADLSGASNQGAGYIKLPAQSGIGSLDFWILGQQTNGQAVTQLVSGGSTTVQIRVGTSGQLEAWTGVTTLALSVSSGIAVNDGYWHHVGLVVVGTTTYLYCDGTFTAITGLTASSLSTSGNLNIGASGTNVTFNGQVDEIVISNVVSIPQAQIQQRYTAGTMLQKGYPVTSNKVLSGDRIAEVLVLAGWGTINNDGGLSSTCTLSVSNYLVGSAYQTAYAYTYGSSVNGYASVEPYYWDSPVTGSTALDLIQQATDTDLGSFYQQPDGYFRFDTQNYFGTWNAGTATAVTATTLTDSTQSWTTNQWVGVILNSGTSSAIVTSNTATTLTFSAGWTGGTPALGYYWMWLPSSAASSYTWSDTASGGALHYDGPSAEVIFDDADTWTTVRITPQSGTDQIYENVTAEARWGFSTLSKSATVSTSLADALSTAYFLGYLYRQPLWRVNNVTLMSETGNGTNLPSMLGAGLGDIISFQRTMPNASGANAISARMVIESITHDFVADPGTWHSSFVLDPYPVHN